jgi:hypothetical protein
VRCWKVKTAVSTTTVLADYFETVDGALWLFNGAPTTECRMASPVRVYAPHAWVGVTPETNERGERIP